MKLPSPPEILPAKTRWAIWLFWIRYWGWFFVLLPVMLAIQPFVIGANALVLLRTLNRSFTLLDGRLVVTYIATFRTALLTLLFGERFLVIRYAGAVIDPGPPIARPRVLETLALCRAELRAVLVTHAHEEHIGNAGAASAALAVPLLGSELTLECIRKPAQVPFMRRHFIGQPDPWPHSVSAPVDDLAKYVPELVAIPADGHCPGHVSFYAPHDRILFAGDSFLHETFTAPNGDVDSAQWIATLARYDDFDISIMIGSHGFVTTLRADVTGSRAVVERADPNELLGRKRRFIEWARDVVADGERRGLPYSVIEACLFPWSRRWSWSSWFWDEAARLLSGGEFSRTQFVRSLSATPARVPARFPFAARLIARFRKRK